jgi:hypothetical protein
LPKVKKGWSYTSTGSQGPSRAVVKNFRTASFERHWGGFFGLFFVAPFQEYAKYATYKLFILIHYDNIHEYIGFIRLRSLGPFTGAKMDNAFEFSYWQSSSQPHHRSTIFVNINKTVSIIQTGIIVTSCSLVVCYQYFRRSCRFHLQGRRGSQAWNKVAGRTGNGTPRSSLSCVTVTNVEGVHTDLSVLLFWRSRVHISSVGSDR